MNRRVRRKKQKTAGRNYTIYWIGLPAEIGNKIPADMEFTVELTEEGILFKPAKPRNGKQAPLKLPKWLDE